jgi:hypothetical protein
MGAIMTNDRSSPVSAQVPVPSDGINGCIAVAARALDYLAQYKRPYGGQQNYNAEHLVQLASELRRTSAALDARPGVAQSPDQQTVSFPRWWVQKCHDQLKNMGQLPAGPLGDWAFLFRDILSDALAKSSSPDTSTVRLPLPVKHYTGMPGAMINGETVYDWLMDDGSVEAMTASDVEKRIKGPDSSPDRQMNEDGK